MAAEQGIDVAQSRLGYDIVSLADIQESGQKMDKWMKASRSKKGRKEKRTTKKAAKQPVVE